MKSMGVAPLFAQGAQKGTPLPLFLSFSPTQATTGHLNRMGILHPIHPPPSFVHLYVHNSSPFCLQPPVKQGNNTRMNTQGPCPPFALGVWKGMYFSPLRSLGTHPSPCCHASSALYSPPPVSAPCLRHAQGATPHSPHA